MNWWNQRDQASPAVSQIPLTWSAELGLITQESVAGEFGAVMRRVSGCDVGSYV